MVGQESKRNTSSLLQIQLKNTEKYQKNITKYKNAKKKIQNMKNTKKNVLCLNVLKHIGLNSIACSFPFQLGGSLGLSPLNLKLNFAFLIRKSTSEHGQALNGGRVNLDILHR